MGTGIAELYDQRQPDHPRRRGKRGVARRPLPRGLQGQDGRAGLRQAARGQTPLPMEQHWRKHTLAFTNGSPGETQLKYRAVIDHTLDAEECATVPPAIRSY